MPPIPVVGGSLGFGQTFATSTYGTTLTASASANAKGAAVELVTATPHDAHWIEVIAAIGDTSAVSFAIDILAGAATEEVLIPNLLFTARATTEGGGRWLFPVFVPKNTRIAARLAASTGSKTCVVAVTLFNAGIGAGGQAGTVAQYGTITTSRGTNVDPGAVAHTKSAWVQITAATLWDHAWLTITVQNAVSVTWSGAAKWLIDVGIGAATEQVLVADLPLGGSTTTDVHRPDESFSLPVFVPKGSRLTVRAQCSSTTDNDRDLYVVIHGA